MSDPHIAPSPGGVDPFEELRALVRSGKLLGDPRASGEGVRVALVDTGVEREVLEARSRQRGLACYPIEGAIFTHDRPEPLAYEGHQSSPHGTTVADIILALAPRARLYSADVFGPAGTTVVEVVLHALRHAIEVWQCKVVNLSLGVSEQRLRPLQRRQELLRAIEDAYYRDVIVVAAAHNDHPLVHSYPAVFAPPLLSVDKGLFDDPLKLHYAQREHVEFVAHGRGYWGPFAQEPATSWAAPHVTGIVARLLSLRPDLKPFEVKTLLYWMSGER